MANLFQPNVFQNNVFQHGSTPVTATLGRHVRGKRRVLIPLLPEPEVVVVDDSAERIAAQARVELEAMMADAIRRTIVNRRAVEDEWVLGLLSDADYARAA